jgi:hypothetical protein
VQRPLPRFAPKGGSIFDQTRQSEVTRQQLRPALGNLGELAFQSFGDTGMKRASRLAQQRPIGGVLDQSMFEQIARMRRPALPE